MLGLQSAGWVLSLGMSVLLGCVCDAMLCSLAQPVLFTADHDSILQILIKYWTGCRADVGPEPYGLAVREGAWSRPVMSYVTTSAVPTLHQQVRFQGICIARRATPLL